MADNVLQRALDQTFVFLCGPFLPPPVSMGCLGSRLIKKICTPVKKKKKEEEKLY